MKKFISSALLIITFIFLLFIPVFVSATDTTNVGGDKLGSQNKKNADYVNESKGWSSTFFGGSQTGEKGVQGLTVTLARDLKTVFIAIAVVYMFVLVLRLFFGQGSEEDLKKWRLGILWTTIGIIFIQISYVAFVAINDKAVGAGTAKDLTDMVLVPIIGLLEIATSFLFIAIALMAFYRIITSGGSEDGYKKGVSTIINAIIGFLLVKISSKLVRSIYGGEATCTGSIGQQECTVTTAPNLPETTKIIASIIQWMTGFVSIITLLLIVYAGFMILTSSGDDTKVKKGKSVIKYIVIGMIMITSSVMIFHFITGRDFNGIIGQYR